MTELWELGVAELAEAVRARELDPVEVVEAFASRAREVDAAVNCFVAFDDDAPGAAARLVRSGDGGPLAGVPYAYKDVFVRGGEPPTVGARGVTMQFRATGSTVLARLEQAGAIPLGSLNLDPFAYAATGANPELGDTRNPWDLTRIAGGSSGGAAAAVAAGAVPFAIGTDAGGSVRIPAGLCGVTGLKPTLGRIPKTGAAPLTYSQDTVGILARSARDVGLVLAQVAGHDPDDSSSIPAPAPGPPGDSCEGVRLGFDPKTFATGTTSELAVAATAALEVLVELGAELVEVDLSLLEGFDAAATVLTWAEALAVHEHSLRSEPTRYAPAVRARLELALAAHGADHVNALRLQGRALAELLEGPLARADVLVAPTIAAPATTIASLGENAVSVSIGHLRLNRPFNFTGVPALAIPIGFDNGLPLAFQLVGRPWDEPTLLACAVGYQRETDWHRRFPPLDAVLHA